ncbi:MAG: PEGA domain-containing protein [Methanoregula sp.]|nr:MAG: PEGA domain-containing protein [Methanoregula sp.]
MRFKNHLLIVLIVIFFCVVLSGCISSDQNSGKGTLNLTSKPSGAEVYLDNQFRGSTPCTIPDLNPGMYNIELRLKGYQSWSTDVAVSSGIYQFNALLKPAAQQNIETPSDISQQTPRPPLQAGVTITANREAMVIGDSISFSGTGPAGSNVLLTLYGPGYYAKGVLLDQPKTNAVGSWSYKWNPGYSVQSGSYTMVVDDPEKVSSGRVEFSVTGGGEVTISANRFFASKGDTITFSGRCTTGAKTVLLILAGPDRFSSGVEISSPSVTADKTWSYTYTFDSSMPAGYYTMTVNDIPRTATSNVQFTLGSSFAS